MRGAALFMPVVLNPCGMIWCCQLSLLIATSVWLSTVGFDYYTLQHPLHPLNKQSLSVYTVVISHRASCTKHTCGRYVMVMVLFHMHTCMYLEWGCTKTTLKESIPQMVTMIIKNFKVTWQAKRALMTNIFKNVFFLIKWINNHWQKISWWSAVRLRRKHHSNTN